MNIMAGSGPATKSRPQAYAWPARQAWQVLLLRQLCPALVFGLADLPVAVGVGVNEVIGQWRIRDGLFLCDRLATARQLFERWRRSDDRLWRWHTSYGRLALCRLGRRSLANSCISGSRRWRRHGLRRRWRWRRVLGNQG